MKKLSQLAILISFILILSGCEAANLPANTNSSAPAANQESNYNQAVSNPEVNTTTAKPAVVQNIKPGSVAVKKVSAAKEYYLVTKVVDGDTLDLYINGTAERVRLIGIDTPEVVDPRKPVQCFGVEASDRAKAILTGQSVALEKDPSQGERDKYGRMLGYVFLKDGTNFNKQMILEGYAHEYTYNLPYKYQADFKAAEKYARENKLGLWDENVCPTSTPTTTDQNTTSNLNTNTASSAPAANEPAGHIFYTSSYPTAKLYYCDTDSNWKGLSARYLKSFSSEQELLAAYSRTLHEPCK